MSDTAIFAPDAAEQNYREQKQHGSRLFPFNLYPCTIPGDFPSVSLHWQNSMELIYIKKGAGRCQVESRTFEAEAGDLFILPPGRLHALYQQPGRVMEYENLIFDVELLGAGLADVCAQEYLVPLAAGRLPLPFCLRPGQPTYPEAAACLARTEEFCEARKPGWQLGVKACLLGLLAVLAAEDTAPRPEPPDMERLRRLLQQSEQDLSQPMTVAQAAALCDCSESNFMRWFRKRTGQSFIAYRNERRLAAAAELLRSSDATVLDIAGQTGFENLSNFNRQFLRRYGLTPRQYRRGC